MKVYAYKNCSTCKKALAFIKANNVGSVEEIDITQTPPTLAELRLMLSVYDGNIRKLFNTSGKMYREKGLSSALKEMTEEEALALLQSEGMLVKRPFLVGSDKGLVGFKESEWEQALL